VTADSFLGTLLLALAGCGGPDVARERSIRRGANIAGDPDRPAYLEDLIPSYVAVRSRSSLLVRYDCRHAPSAARRSPG
jgi:hypothetical protein